MKKQVRRDILTHFHPGLYASRLPAEIWIEAPKTPSTVQYHVLRCQRYLPSIASPLFGFAGRLLTLT